MVSGPHLSEFKSLIAVGPMVHVACVSSLLIYPRYNKLITALRTAVENGEGMLDKETTSHDDLFDAFRMSLVFLH